MRAPDRRRQLIEVAARLFAERGYRGTTTAELAAEAGITEPVLYRHFSSSFELFVSLVEEVGSEVIQAWRERIDAAPDARARLQTLLAGNPATHERGRGVYRVIFQAMSELDGDPAIATAIGDHITALRDFLRKELVALQKEGVVRSDEQAGALAGLLISTAIGFGMVAPLTPARGTPIGSRQSVQRLLQELLAP